MEIKFDEAKRQVVLELRGLDFAEAATIFNAPNATLPDRRRDYGEVRYLTHGLLRGEVVMVVWTPRGECRRIISMRKCHAEERAQYFARVDRSR